MKKLSVVCKNETIVEFHSNTAAAERRLNEIQRKHEVVSSEITDAVKHVEVKSEPIITQNAYISIK